MIIENYILPISGINFVIYIAIFSLISESDIKPKRIYSASGGCLASYIAMMSNFSNSVENWNFNSSMFLKTATPFTPKFLTFSLNGFFFHRQNIDNYVKRKFILSKLQDVEIISGFYESSENSNNIVISSNFLKKDSILNGAILNDLDKRIVARYPEDNPNKKIFLDNLLDFCLDTIYKTTNIPLLVESLGDKKAIDFGLISTTPRLITGANMKKSIYFSPVNIERDKNLSGYELIFFSIIMNDIYEIKKYYTNCEKLNLFSDVIKFIKSKDNYSIIAYTTYKISIFIENFTNTDFKKELLNCKNNIKFIIFYK